MNTPRQPNVRTSIERVRAQFRNSGPPPAAGDATPLANAKNGIPESVATIRTTGTLRLPLTARGRQPMRQPTGQPPTVPAK
jgi:hypothetical protein